MYAGNYREHLFVSPLMEDTEKIFTKDDVHPSLLYFHNFGTQEKLDDHNKFKKSLNGMNFLQKLRAMGNRAKTNSDYKEIMGRTFFKSGGVDTSDSTREKLADYLNEIIDHAKTAPKSWIGKKIESLRSLYSQYLVRLNYTRKAGNNFLDRATSTILSMIGNAIDWLLRKLQNFAG